MHAAAPTPVFWLRTRLAYSAVLVALALYFAIDTLKWRWMWDDSVMHYGNFLMDHGMVLYRDILDMNMPGCYFIEGWWLHLFGGSDLAARGYEYFLLAILTVSAIVIALPYDWFAGLFAGVLFALLHAAEGAINSAQREEAMTALMLASFAVAFVSLRRRLPWLLLPAGFLVGMTIALKPTAAPVGIVLLAMIAVALRRRREPLLRYMVYGFAGLGVAALVVAEFFVRTHSFTAFVDIMRRLLPYYAGMQQTPYRLMIRPMLGRAVPLLLPFTAALTLVHRDWRNWERWALAFGMLFGVFSHFAQHKGFYYHRYPFMAFFFLWAGLEATRGLRETGWRRWAGLATVSLGVLVVAPLYAYRTTHQPYETALPDRLEQDLATLGGPQLDHKVQCVDMVSGCMTALYHMNLTQATGMIGDLVIFPPHNSAPSPYYRQRFLEDLERSQPKVMVVTDAWFAEDPSFAKLDEWPVFEGVLRDRYTLAATRRFDSPAEVKGEISYRLYLAKDAPELAGRIR